MTGEEDPYTLAACLGTETNLFFPQSPLGRAPDGTDLYAEARTICGACPISQRCAHDHRHERFGMWGGTTSEDRGFIRRRRLHLVRRPSDQVAS